MFDNELLNEYLPDTYKLLTKAHSDCYHIGQGGYIIGINELNMADFTFNHKNIVNLFDITAIIPNSKRFTIRYSSSKAAVANSNNLAKKCTPNKIPLVCTLPNNSRYINKSAKLSGISYTAVVDLTKIYAKNTEILEWLLYLSNITKRSNKELSEAYSSVFTSMLTENAIELLESGEALFYHNGRSYKVNELEKLVEVAFPLNCDYLYRETSYAYKTVAYSHLLAIGIGAEKPNIKAAALNLDGEQQISLFQNRTAHDIAERLSSEMKKQLIDNQFFTVLDIVETAMRPPFGFDFNNIESFALGRALVDCTGLMFEDSAHMTYIAGKDTYLNRLSFAIKEAQSEKARKSRYLTMRGRHEYFFQKAPFIDIFVNNTNCIFGGQNDRYFMSSAIIDACKRINEFHHIYYFIEYHYEEQGQADYARLTNMYYRLCASGRYEPSFRERLGLMRDIANLTSNINVREYRDSITEGNIKRGMDIYFAGADYSRIFHIIPEAARWLWNKELYRQYVFANEAIKTQSFCSSCMSRACAICTRRQDFVNGKE